MLKDLIKAGKGYRDGIPYGVIGRDCDECGTPIVSIKMATSQKGMQCTSESVCPACGLIHQGPFAILDRYEDDYRTNEFESHDDWLAQMKQEPHDYILDIDEGLESKCLWDAKRKGSSTDFEYGDSGYIKPKTTYKPANVITNNNSGNPEKKPWRTLNDAKQNLKRHNPSKMIPSHRVRELKYEDFIDSLYSYLSTCKTPIKDYKLIIEDVKLLVKHIMKFRDRGIQTLHQTASYQEIITCILVWRATKSLGRKIIGLKNELGAIGETNKNDKFIPYFSNDKYKVIKPRLDDIDSNKDQINIKNIVRPMHTTCYQLNTFNKTSNDIKYGNHLKRKDRRFTPVNLTEDNVLVECASET